MERYVQCELREVLRIPQISPICADLWFPLCNVILFH